VVNSVHKTVQPLKLKIVNKKLSNIKQSLQLLTLHKLVNWYTNIVTSFRTIIRTTIVTSLELWLPLEVELPFEVLTRASVFTWFTTKNGECLVMHATDIASRHPADNASDCRYICGQKRTRKISSDSTHYQSRFLAETDIKIWQTLKFIQWICTRS
jgi:hypothetical protein